MMRLTALALVACVAASFAQEKADPKDPKAGAREIDLKGIVVTPEENGSQTVPLKISTAADLAKVVEAPDDRKALLKTVNLKTETLLLFRWAGSGGDRVAVSTGKDGGVTFTATKGFTRDLRQHTKLFAIPADAKYVVKAGEPKFKNKIKLPPVKDGE